MQPIEALALCFAVLGLLVVMVFYFIARQRPGGAIMNASDATPMLDDLEEADLVILELYDDAEVVEDGSLWAFQSSRSSDPLFRRTAKVYHLPTGEIRLVQILVAEEA